MTPLPDRFGLALDPSVRSFRDRTVLVGGVPGRVITLTAAGRRALASLLAEERERTAGPVPAPEEARRLGRRLVDAGMAHPRPRRGTARGGAPLGHRGGPRT